MNTRRVSLTSLSRAASLLAIGVAAIGCASQTPAARDARLAGEWTFRLPETHSPYSDLAIGQGGQPSTLGLVDEALASSAGPERAARQAKPRQRPAVQLAKHSAAAPQPTTATLPAPSVQPERPEPLALNAPQTAPGDERLYAQRESQSQKQRDFRGGDAIVISVTALIIIVLVVLLIILLT